MVNIEIIFENTDSVNIKVKDEDDFSKSPSPLLVTLEGVTKRVLVNNHRVVEGYTAADIFLSIPKELVKDQLSWVMPGFTGWDLLVNYSISTIEVDGIVYNVAWGGDDQHLNSLQETSVQTLSDLEESRVVITIKKE